MPKKPKRADLERRIVALEAEMAVMRTLIPQRTWPEPQHWWQPPYPGTYPTITCDTVSTMSAADIHALRTRIQEHN